MEITVRGWRRWMGDHRIMGSELRAFERGGEPSVLNPSNIYSYADTENGTVNVAWSTRLRFNGRYLVRLQLDKAEVLKMFIALYGDTPLSELVSLISSDKRPAMARKGKSKRTKPSAE